MQNSIRVFESASEAIEFFVSLNSDVHGGLSSDGRHLLVDLLYSGESLVPSFHSPPSAWMPLRNVAEQASAIGIGVTWGGGGIPALLGAYIGGLFLVKFVTPIVAEAGNATAAGVGTKSEQPLVWLHRNFRRHQPKKTRATRRHAPRGQLMKRRRA